jgi:hypothetical protein
MPRGCPLKRAKFHRQGVLESAEDHLSNPNAAALVSVF